MSGHSKWSNIKYKKEIADKRKAQVFSKLTRMITLAAKEGGQNPETNTKLQQAIEKAKSFNLPNDNIKRAIEKASAKDAQVLENFLIEAFGPGQVAILIEGVTDNKKRTFSEIKNIIEKHSGKVGSGGSIRWLFDQRGLIEILPDEQDEEFKKPETLEMLAIDSGAEDFFWKEGVFNIITEPKELQEIFKNIQDRGVKIGSFGLSFIAKEKIRVEDKDIQSKLQTLFESLDENEAIQEIYSNLE